MPDVVELRFRDEMDFEAADFPLDSVKIDLQLGLSSDDVPDVAYQRLVAAALRRLARHAEEGRALARPANGAPAAPIVQAAPAAQGKQAVAQEAEDWSVPDGLHLKTAKTAHRFLVAAASLVERGPAPSLGEVAEKARMSGPPVAKIANSDTAVGKYLAPLIHVEKKGRSKIVDVTPLGRKVASLVRAGKLPT